MAKVIWPNKWLLVLLNGHRQHTASFTLLTCVSPS
jgi:hypothetical protein